MTRLARMVGHPEPSTHELLSNIHRRVSTLPPSWRKRYNQDGIAEALARIKSLGGTSSSKSSSSGEKVVGNEALVDSDSDSDSNSTSTDDGSGYSQAELDAANDNRLTPAETPTYNNSVGLGIEYVAS